MGPPGTDVLQAQGTAHSHLAMRFRVSHHGCQAEELQGQWGIHVAPVTILECKHASVRWHSSAMT